MTVLDEAQNIGGVVSAARRRERWMREMANTGNEEKREALREAVADLEGRFPEIEDLGPGEAERFARERGHGKGARSPSHEGRTRHRPAAKPKPAPSRPSASRSEQSKRSSQRSTSSSRSSRSSSATPPSRLRRRGRQAYRETGIPAGGASISRVVMSALGATVGLSALYLLLSSAERNGSGGQALVGLLDGVTAFLRRIIAPVDFFGPALSQREYSRAVAGTGQRANEKLLSQLPKLPPARNPTPAKPLHVRPAELGFTPSGGHRSHKRR